MFSKIESWNNHYLFEIELCETSQNFNSFRQFLSSIFLLLKFCEVSQNSVSNRCWKFQLSILKNKKVLFLKKYSLGRCQYKKNFVYSSLTLLTQILMKVLANLCCTTELHTRTAGHHLILDDHGQHAIYESPPLHSDRQKK